MDILENVILPHFESVETFSEEEFRRFVREREEQGDVHRFELLNGRIAMNPPAGWPHGSVAASIVTRLTSFAVPRLGRVFDSSQGFRLPSHDVVEPDASYVSRERWERCTAIEGDFLEVVPDLVVEILSPSTAHRDKGEKRAIYEKNGVREYWLVDPRARTVTLLVLDGEAYREHSVAGLDGSTSSCVLAGLSFATRELFEV